MQDFPEMPWMERYRERVNADPEMELVGAWFSSSLSLTFGERRYVVRMERGRMTEINAAPRCALRVRLSRAARRVAQVRKPRAPGAVPRLLRHADAGARIRPGGRQPGRDAERAGAAAHDESDAGLTWLPLRRSSDGTSRFATRESISRRRDEAFRSFACTPRAPTAGSGAMCSTMRTSRGAFA